SPWISLRACPRSPSPSSGLSPRLPSGLLVSPSEPARWSSSVRRHLPQTGRSGSPSRESSPPPASERSRRASTTSSALGSAPCPKCGHGCIRAGETKRKRAKLLGAMPAKVPRLVPGVDIRNFKLDPTDGFLLTRVDGKLGANDLARETGL